MCTQIAFLYHCQHTTYETARCAASRSGSCGIIHTRRVKHSHNCDGCDSKRPETYKNHERLGERKLTETVSTTTESERAEKRQIQEDGLSFASISAPNTRPASATESLSEEMSDATREEQALADSVRGCSHPPSPSLPCRLKKNMPLELGIENKDTARSGTDTDASISGQSNLNLLDERKESISADPLKEFKSMAHCIPQGDSHSSKDTFKSSREPLAGHCGKLIANEGLSSWSLVIRVRPDSSQNGPRTSHSNMSRRVSSQSPSKALGKHTQPFKPNRHFSEGDGDEEDGFPTKRPKASSPAIANPKRRFACPYFKRDSEKYLSRRSCVGPGWEEVRRVKEHLYRNHALPIFCPRCYQTFKTEGLLHDHQRANDPCDIRPQKLVEGFNKQQEKCLRCRKRKHVNALEEDKWKDMYRILFPDDDETDMPSPYLERDWETIYQRGDNELAHYERFLRRELPSAIRRALESGVESGLNPVEERLKFQFVQIVRDVQVGLFQTYTLSRSERLTQAEEATNASSECELAREKAGPMPNTLPSKEAENLATTGRLLMESERPFVLEDNGLVDGDELSLPIDMSTAPGFESLLFPFDRLDDFGALADTNYGSVSTDYSFVGGRFDDNLDPLGYGCATGEGSSKLD